jgi:ankyrin repeat protein
VADGNDVFMFCQVVELLLTRGANKEHRNVSDYTPLILAASGGYVNIIKLLLAHGAEINSRTGSKLGISPLMLAAMNGHTGKFHFLCCDMKRWKCTAVLYDGFAARFCMSLVYW